MEQQCVVNSGVPNRQVFAAVSRLRERGFTVTHKANPNGDGVVWSINGGECLNSAGVWAFLNDVLHPTTAVSDPIVITFLDVIQHNPSLADVPVKQMSLLEFLGAG